MSLPCLSLWQPWASAIAIELKRVETRDWPTRHRGWLAIHAAKAWGAEQEGALDRLGPLLPDPAALPRGVVVCVVELLDCVRMTEEWIDSVPLHEQDWGAYLPGRFGWVLGRVIRTRSPEPSIRGRPGLWVLSPEEDAVVRAALVEPITGLAGAAR